MQIHESIKPKLQERIIILGKDDKILFLDPEQPDWIVTNHNGAAAISLCDGKSSLFNISEKISKSANKDLRGEVYSFLKEVLEKHSLFEQTICSKDFKHNLRIAQIALSRSCNLKCIYCYASSRLNSTYNNLSLQEYFSLIDDINDISKNVGIVLTGGEPLLSDDCIKIGQYAAKSGNNPHLLTNGILISDNNAQSIAETFSLIKISVDGCTSEIHDYHRGEGTYRKVLKSIEKLDSFDAKISLSMTVTSKNIHTIGEMASKFGNLLSFQPLFSAGRAKGINELSVTGSEYYAALSGVSSINPLSKLSSRLEKARNNGIYKCAIGDAEISISETGDVFPCQLLHEKQFWAGNIRTKPLQKIYYNSEVLKKCRKHDIRNIEGCSDCPVRLICGGSCRARAFHENGDINKSGDFCVYEYKAIINGIFDSYEI